MEAKDLEFFREYLTQMIDDIQRQGEATIEDMSENVEYYSDPADRPRPSPDRTFTLRLRDRDRKLIKKINEALDRIEDVDLWRVRGLQRGHRYSRPQGPPGDDLVHRMQESSGRGRAAAG